MQIRKRALSFALLLLIMLQSSIAVYADESESIPNADATAAASVTGNVVECTDDNEQEKGIENISFQMSNEKNSYGTASDENGCFEIEDVVCGEYSLAFKSANENVFLGDYEILDNGNDIQFEYSEEDNAITIDSFQVDSDVELDLSLMKKDTKTDKDENVDEKDESESVNPDETETANKDEAELEEAESTGTTEGIDEQQTQEDINTEERTETEGSEKNNPITTRKLAAPAKAPAASNYRTTKTGTIENGIPYEYGKGYFEAVAGANYANFAAGSGLKLLTAKAPQKNNIYFVGSDNTNSARTAALYEISNKAFNNNTYIDCYHCGLIENQDVDARIFLKLGTKDTDNCPYTTNEKAAVVVYKNGLIEFGTNTIYGVTSSGGKDEKNVIFKAEVPAFVCFRVKFYKGGTLKSGTSNPVYGKGYCLIKDIDGAEFDSKTPYKWEGVQVPKAGTGGIYFSKDTTLGINTSTKRTQLTNTWWWNGSDKRTTDDDVKAHIGITYNASSNSVPFEFQYHAAHIYWVVLRNGTHNVSYNIVKSGNYVWPKRDGTDIPSSEIAPTTKRLAQYCDISMGSNGGGKELFTNTSNANATLAAKYGYKWIPWKTASNLSGSNFADEVSKKTPYTLTKNIALYGGFQLKTGKVTVTKSVSAPSFYTGGKSGFQFKLAGTALNGTSVNMTATSDSNGSATFSNVPMGSYTVSEINLANKWKVDSASKSVSLSNDGETKNVTFTNTYKTGTVNIVKTVTDSTNTHKALAGFVFRVAGKADGYTINKTATTGEDGKASVTELPAGTYTVTEIGVPGSVSSVPSYWSSGKTNNAATVTIAEGGTGTVAFNNTFVPAKVKVKKVSTTNSNTIVSGAQYTLYTDSACKNIAKDVGNNDVVFTTTTTSSNTVNLYPGTYYLKETASPTTYKLNSTVYTVTAKSNETVTVNTSDEPLIGHVKMNVKSSDPNLTDDNRCYTLKNAVYHLYSDANCTQKVGTFTTLEDGTTNTLDVVAGTYYIKQQTASDGYGLCDSATTHDGASSANIHTVQVEADKTKIVDCLEPPLNDPFNLQLTKMDADKKENKAQGSAGLSGAIFKIEYFDNRAGTTTGNAKKSWFFITDNEGKLNLSKESNLLSSYTNHDNVTFKSDELYKDPDGVIEYPLGTYVIKEIQPPKYYQLDGTFKFSNAIVEKSVKDGITVLINEDEQGEAKAYYEKSASGSFIAASQLLLNSYDKIYHGSIKVDKGDANGNALAGVEFKLVGDDGSEYSLKTNSDGMLTFDNLIPQHYVLTETKTVDGQNLLKNNIDITLPLELSENQIGRKGANKDDAVWDEMTGKYCFYNVSYNINNTPTMTAPFTGEENMMLPAILGIAGLFAFCGVIALNRKEILKFINNK